MLCIHCGTSYRLTKLHIDKASCLDCSGVTDDLQIDDSELQVDLWRLKNPSGKTAAFIEDDNDE